MGTTWWIITHPGAWQWQHVCGPSLRSMSQYGINLYHSICGWYA